LEVDIGVKFGPSPSNGSTSTAGPQIAWRRSGNGRDRDQDSIAGSIVPTPVDLATPTFGDAETIFKYVGAESEKDDDDDDNDDNESSESRESDLEPPHPNLELQGNALTAQLEITNRLVETIVVSSKLPNTQTQTHEALTESVQYNSVSSV